MVLYDREQREGLGVKDRGVQQMSYPTQHREKDRGVQQISCPTLHREKDRGVPTVELSYPREKDGVSNR